MRKPHPWYRRNRGWFVTVDGKQIPLGIQAPNDQAGALAAWERLKAPRPLVADLVPEYLDKLSKRAKAHTVAWARGLLRPFEQSFGSLTPIQVSAEMLEDSARRLGWSSSTRNTYLGAALSFLSWCGVRIRVRKPPKQSAGAKSIISPETYRAVLMLSKGDWRAIVQTLWLTGARPSELARLTVEMVDWEQRVARLDEHKTDHSGEPRLIYFNCEAFAVLEAQRARYGTGLLFRSKVGTMLKRQAFVRKFVRISRRIGRRVCAYAFRHSWASRALAGGESDTIVAALMGHKSTAMVHRHYAHINEQGRALRDAANRIGRAG